MPTYSIIIPVYNVEKYLESCVDSVMDQSSESSFEVILVDDGSSDRSPEICDCYAQRFSNVKVIHQVNQGVSAARNAGIAAAEGAYVLFLDSDDCWDSELLSALDQIVPSAPDIIEFGYCIVRDDVSQELALPAVQASGQTGEAYIREHSDRNCMPLGSSCVAAFRKQLLDTYRICFPIGVTYGEDFVFHMLCLKYAQAVYSICAPLYRYRMNETSATHIPSVRKARDMLVQCARVYRLFPHAMFADYYCLVIPYIAKLKKADVKQLTPLLRENRDILRRTAGRSAQLARILYGIFGWYHGSRLIQFAINRRHAKKG